MGRTATKWLAMLVAVFCCAFAQATAHAATGQAASCIVDIGGDFSLDQLTDSGAHWTCEGSDLHVAEQRSLSRYDLASGAREDLRFLRTRIGLFDRLTLAVVDADGTMRTRAFETDDVKLVSGEPMFLAELPEIDADSRALFMLVDRPQHDATVLRATLYVEDPSRTNEHLFGMLVLAILLGMMFMPVLFDLAFWTALKKDFLLWHGALSLSFAALVFLRSGLVVEVLDISLETWRAALIITLGVATLMAAMFTCAFVEEGRLDPRLRKALPIGGAWALFASLIHAAGLDILAPLGGAFHSYALAPVLLLFILAMTDAYRKGSRAIRFQLFGWVPLLLAFSVQLVSYVFPLGLPTDALPLFYVGVLSETTVTAIGVADRFLALRRERDRAVLLADELGMLSHKDPMTGLMNRRGLGERFKELRSKGFTNFALLDLDSFKQINDRFGHAVGDEVLKATADALRAEPGRNTVAIRMGGEEFLVLLRGPMSAERAETLRTGITRRVASEVVGLDRAVTASMGMICAPPDAKSPMSLEQLYSRADKLLYEAKAAGRNRTVHERLFLFGDETGESKRETIEAA